MNEGAFFAMLCSLFSTPLTVKFFLKNLNKISFDLKALFFWLLDIKDPVIRLFCVICLEKQARETLFQMNWVHKQWPVNQA